ncbi:MAG: B12-binding domain-containing radical SAM protein [Candidatus Saganbacteria bacterium]|nr:B12-binding domain-containing radical SAM protein [Candidatus Saganbacteria bacterium]
MPNKILLIRPNNVYNYNNYPPLSLISIGSQLEAAGFDIKIIDCVFEADHLKTIGDELKDALLVGISLMTSEAPDAYQIMKYVKESSSVPVMVGGPHCTLFPQQMADCKYVDYVVAGEGEKHVLQIAQALKAGQPAAQKIFYKEILNLEELPMPDYSLDTHIEQFISSYLTDKLSEFAEQPLRWLPYESSRGCPSQCTFCINVVTKNNRYRKKSPEKVLAEIEQIVRKYRLTHLKIIDDNFFVDIERVRRICERLVEKGLKITWDGECRCDYFNDRMINDATLKLLKRSGLVQLTLGIESGSQHTLKLMKKGITPEQAENAVKKCDEYGIIARSSFILEIPGETLADIKQTIKFVNKLRKYRFFTCGVNTFRPYPMCELTERLKQEGYLQEPSDFVGWTDRQIIDMYTAAEYVRPWQVNGNYSESAAYYLNMESAIRLGNYQISDPFDRLKNSLFMLAARVRNRLGFYGLPVDKVLYKHFFDYFYKKQQAREKKSALRSTDSVKE